MPVRETIVGVRTSVRPPQLAASFILNRVAARHAFVCNRAATSEMFLRRNNENDSRGAKLKVGFDCRAGGGSGQPDTVILMARSGPSGILFESDGPIALRRYQGRDFVRPPINDPCRHGFRRDAARRGRRTADPICIASETVMVTTSKPCPRVNSGPREARGKLPPGY